MKQLLLDGKLVPLKPDTTIALTKSICDIGDIGNRDSDFTNEFDLPKSQELQELLELPEKINGASAKPYQKINASVIENGVELVSNGFMILEGSGDSHKGTVYGGNADFFQLIEGEKLEDMDFSDAIYAHNWALTDIFGSKANTAGFVYPIIDWGAYDNLSRTINVGKLLPALFVHSLLTQIATEKGYTLAGNLISNDKYTKLLLPVTGNQLKDINLLAKCKPTIDRNYSKPSQTVVSIFGIKFDDHMTDPFLLLNEQTVVMTGGTITDTTTYTCYNAGTFDFKTVVDYSGTGHSNSSWDLRLRVIPFGSTVLSQDIAITMPPVNSAGQLIINMPGIAMNKGDRAFVYLQINSALTTTATITIFGTSTFECTKAVVTAVTFGNPFPIADNIPKFSKTELFKLVARVMCAMWQVDSSTKTIHWRQFNEIANNKGQAIDITDLVDESHKTEVEYHATEYAQQNWMRYKEDGSVPLQLGDGYFYIDDETLEPEKDLFTLPVAATEMTYKLLDLEVPYIDKYDSGANLFSHSIQPRLLLLDYQTITGAAIGYTDNVNTSSSNDVPLCYFIKAQKDFSLGFNDNVIEENYDSLVQVLTKYKKITERVNWSLLDIKGMDIFKPVYIAKHANYFYINRIDNFVNGELTDTELIRL